MASNFKILFHRNAENLHLKLYGDFDGSSAWELINGLKRTCYGISRIFIHTNCLKHVHPFGREVLQKNLYESTRKSVCVVFTGEKASVLAPETMKEAKGEKGTGEIVQDQKPGEQTMGGSDLNWRVCAD